MMASSAGGLPALNREQTFAFFEELAAGRLPFVIPEGGGEEPKAQFIRGFLGCDLGPYNPVLSALPRLLRVCRPDGQTPDLLGRLIDMTIAETRANRVGAQSIRVGLSELIFVEVLRRRLASASSASSDRPNWLTGLRDPIVGRALAQIHASPNARWTRDDLARESGASRSVLADRFAATIGVSFIRYLAARRLQLAARLRADGDDKISAVAAGTLAASEPPASPSFFGVGSDAADRRRRG